jgi:uncharacterized protein YndB with AHSA1/START domain
LNVLVETFERKEKNVAKTEIISTPGVPQIVVTREFNASPEILFRAYVEPDLVKQWLAPRDYEITVEQYDVRDGGKWRYVHHDNQGNSYGFHGVFHGTASVEGGIVQTFEFEGAPGHVSLDTATFENRGGKTLLRLNSVFQSVEARDAMIQSGMEDGLTQSLDHLDELIAALAPVS